MSEKSYKCPKGSCSKDLTRKEFGKNIAYFCPDHGLVRTELYMRETPEDVVEAPVVEAPVVEAPLAEPEVIDPPTKPKRTRKVATGDSQE